MVNKYEQQPGAVIDLHGYTTAEAEVILRDVITHAEHKHIRIITGKGNRSEFGPVLPNFVKSYLNARNILYRQSKIQDGGAGALEVFLTK
jgi:DNA-nicking Smr family endonuclease